MMDWTYLIAVTLPMIFLCWMWYLLHQRIEALLRLMHSLHDRLSLAEANDKILYELHKRKITP